ncbi:unnamed protein product [Rhizopus stolonifer]
MSINEENYMSNSDSIQEAIRRSLSETGQFDLVSDEDSSVIFDLTATNQHNAVDEEKPSNPLEDDIYAFFVEAGLENPEQLSMLGIDIETIRAQKELEERIERETKANLETARQLQSEYEREIEPLSRSDSFVSQTSLKREIDHIIEEDKKKLKVEHPVDSIDLDNNNDNDDDAILIDLTMEEDDRVMNQQSTPVVDYLSNVSWNNYTPNSASSAYSNKAKQKAAVGRAGSRGGDGGFNMDPGSYPMPSMTAGIPMPYPPNMQHMRSMPFTPMYMNHPPIAGPSRVPPSFGGSSGSNNSRRVPASMQQDLMAAINRQITQNPYELPQIRPTYVTSEEAEKELRELLENIVDDELPPPEDRTGTPERMSINLLEHQKIGLQWMVKQEKSNNKGGILADDMGLGKTIQAMAVVCSNICEDATEVDLANVSNRTTTVSGELQLKATLIVCPVSLIDQWRREIESKTDPKLNVLVYHGTRTKNPYDLVPYDVIVSSYAVVATDNSEHFKGPLSKVKFHRVILDEAHTIKNKNTKAAQGCRKVEASFRWCMTATPIQNKVEELYSLISFLRIRPFCIWEEFRDAICKPMKAGNTAKAIKVAHVLMKAVSLRRSKKAMIDGRPILNLPERNVHMDFIEFSADERTHYNFVNDRAQARFTKYLNANTVMKNYSSVLVMLLRLRQACLHPNLTTEEGDPTANPSAQLEQADTEAAARQLDTEVVRRLLNDTTTIKEIECPICMDTAQDAQIMQCGHILCKECFDSYWNNPDGNTKRCPQCRGPIDRQKLVDIESFLKVHAPELIMEEEKKTEEETKELQKIAEMHSSAKVDRMLQILLETSQKTNNKDKTIVFSQFTAMLDLLEKPLKSNEIKYLRYDGSMNIRQRAEAVKNFFDDPTISVLLVSTKCGSLGLNLTCANRVILLDVWWNPAIENQAIDRVHRIGQTKAVEVHRIFIKDTVEDRILQLQNKKQAIADGVLGEGEGTSTGRLNLNELIYLFRGGEMPRS